jgi:hypothetical protein
MKVRTMAGFRREPTPHTDWCAAVYRCGITEHRSPDITADVAGGRAVMTRVRAGDVDYAEVRIRIPLSRHDTIARRQVGLALHLIHRLLTAVAAVRPEALARGGERPALGRRAT